MIESIAKVVKCQNLTEDEAAAAFEVIMRGDATPSQIAGFVVALRMKGETVEELTGFARSARGGSELLEHRRTDQHIRGGDVRRQRDVADIADS